MIRVYHDKKTSIHRESHKIFIKLMCDNCDRPLCNEESCTSDFLMGLSEHSKIKYYNFIHQEEAINGADWVWLVYTEQGVYKFLIQAKKIKKRLTKRKALQKSASEYQIDKLIRACEGTDIIPLYAMYSKDILKVPCSKFNQEIDCMDGIFIDTAVNIKSFFITDNKMSEDSASLNYIPISCIFCCFRKHCVYRLKTSEVGCVLLKCSRKKNCSKCGFPFEKIFEKFFNIEIKSSPFNIPEKIIMFESSVLRKNNELKKQIISDCLGEQIFKKVKSILISDYVNRHSDNSAKTLWGDSIIIDTTSVIDTRHIKHVLSSTAKLCPTIKKLGLFGSYARKKRDSLFGHAVTPMSDIDIAVIYDSKMINSKEDLEKFLVFAKTSIETLKKNIDFVDYEYSDGNSDFIEEINKDMIWFYKSGRK